MTDIESFRSSIEPIEAASSPNAIFDPSANRADDTRAASLPECSELDDRLYAILESPGAVGELASQAYARKEAEFGVAFATLSVLESMALHKRLVDPKPTDRLASRFARLIPERRARLLAFLAGARRRAALVR